MNYSTLMVHVSVNGPNAQLLKFSLDLAKRFDARVIGIASCRPFPESVPFGDGFGSGYPDMLLLESFRKEVTAAMTEAEQEFRDAFKGRACEWRGRIGFGPTSDFLVSEARCADLVLTGRTSGEFFDSSRHGNEGPLVLLAGRPVLVVPDSVEPLALEQALVAWKDTRESRRAVIDALPLLALVRKVVVLEIAPEADLPAARLRVADVVKWLGAHDVSAEAMVRQSSGNAALELTEAAKAQRAEFVVAGAYGHSRLREWAFGGVTRSLLLGAEQCAFMSH